MQAAIQLSTGFKTSSICLVYVSTSFSNGALEVVDMFDKRKAWSWSWAAQKC